MKDFIVMLAILPLLIIFVFQFACDYRGFEEVQAVENIVYEAGEKARQEGGFGSETIAGIRSEIAKHVGTDESEVEISVSAGAGEVGRFDDERLIYYTVTVEIPEAMAGGKLLKLKDTENRRKIKVSGYIASEYVGGYV